MPLEEILHSDALTAMLKRSSAQHSPDLRERIILRKLASRMVELQGKGADMIENLCVKHYSDCPAG